MKIALIAIVVIVVIAGFLGLAFLAKDNNQQTNKLAAGTTVFDVRTPAEYAEGHAEKAILLPLASIQAGSLPTVAKDQPIAVYCRSGNRSSQAAKLLKVAGYIDVTDIGAYSDLSKYGLSTT